MPANHKETLETAVENQIYVSLSMCSGGPAIVASGVETDL